MIALLHGDGSDWPNLALARLAAHFRARGEDARLVRAGTKRDLFDGAVRAFGSSIFSFSEKTRAWFDREWGPGVVWGGTGVRVESSLADIDPSVEWEAVKPDLSIYPGDVSVGFTQRGCRLRCGFCVVPRKEGRPRSVRKIADLWRGAPFPRKVLLLDNDFFGQPRDQWQARLDEIRSGRFRVCFAQGINIRLIDEAAATGLASLIVPTKSGKLRPLYRDTKFQRSRLYTAFDNLGDEPIFRRGVESLRAAGVPPKHLMVYMLVGYAKGETWDAIFHRFNELVALGCKPYPMVYDRARKDLLAFARWASTGLYRAVAWKDYRDPRLERVA